MFNNVEWKRGKKTLKQIFNKDLKSTNININYVFFKLSEWLIPLQNKWVLHQERHPAKKSAKPKHVELPSMETSC